MNRVHRPDLKTRSASKAASALELSQSAVSHALARLREQVSDPLFVRIGDRMEPTPRAIRLADPLRDALEAAARVVASEDAVRLEEAAAAEREALKEFTRDRDPLYWARAIKVSP
jgi:DNA-binding transcriptional LysR family regulator